MGNLINELVVILEGKTLVFKYEYLLYYSALLNYNMKINALISLI